MKIYYSHHAEQRLLKRKIAKKLVEVTLKEPDETIGDAFGVFVAHKIIVKNKTAFLLRAFYVKDRENIEVLTAYLTTKIHKYFTRRNL